MALGGRARLGSDAGAGAQPESGMVADMDCAAAAAGGGAARASVGSAADGLCGRIGSGAELAPLRPHHRRTCGSASVNRALRSIMDNSHFDNSPGCHAFASLADHARLPCRLGRSGYHRGGGLAAWHDGQHGVQPDELPAGDPDRLAHRNSRNSICDVAAGFDARCCVR